MFAAGRQPRAVSTEWAAAAVGRVGNAIARWLRSGCRVCVGRCRHKLRRAVDHLACLVLSLGLLGGPDRRRIGWGSAAANGLGYGCRGWTGLLRAAVLEHNSAVIELRHAEINRLDF